MYANPEPGLNLIKKVKLTPKEIEFGKKLIKRSKTGMEIGDNVVIPKHKIKDIETDIIATIISNIKKPFKKAEGGIAGELHLNRPGYAGGKRSLPKQMSLFAKPKIGDALKKLSDAELKKQMRAMKKRWSVSTKANGGLAQVLGV